MAPELSYTNIDLNMIRPIHDGYERSRLPQQRSLESNRYNLVSFLTLAGSTIHDVFVTDSH